ncbi:MAG: pilus assembly protein N-terminal domain-containing protein [Myxococcota bacterium]
MTRVRTIRRGLATALPLAVLGAFLAAPAPASADLRPLQVQLGQNRRIALDDEVVRLAVGDPDVASVQIVSSREILLLGRRPGRTNLILWLADGSVDDLPVRVDRDLSLLARALRDIHPGIEVLSAPDRDAVVLRGVVPEARFSSAAEAVATDYLSSASFGTRRGEVLVVGAGAAPRDEAGPDDDAGADRPGDGTGDAGTDAPSDSGAFVLDEPVNSAGSRIINLIRVEDLPAPIEERLLDAMRAVGGSEITVRRLTAGSLASNARDTFVLEGRIGTQTDLVRALTSAARVLDPDASPDQIRVVADEAGSLGGRRSTSGSGSGSGSTSIAGGGSSLSGVGGSIGGGANGGLGGNNLQSNVARAKALSLAGGQLLSFVEVTRLPQVRLEARIYEVNRSRLRNWSPNLNVLFGNTENVVLRPSVTSRQMQGTTGTPSLISKDEIQGALSLLSGGAVGGLQYVGDVVAVDLALDLLEQESIARALAKPSLSVLSGEVATFNAGGQIPIAVTVNTQTSAAAGTLLSSTVFAEFGVRVAVRPLVGDDDVITLDVTPSISQPDFDLTANLVDSTGSQQSTTAFQTRSLRTTTRLQDGQSFVIGGLLQSTVGRSTKFTPWLHRVPGFGWLGKSRDDQRDELDFVVVVSPSIVYERDSRAALWAYPSAEELLARIPRRP